jgi:formylglycine-generating enzyme required for sulfatase activity/serine/threonine protein kinase
LNPACGRTVGVAEEHLGRRACCPHCGTAFTCARPANEPGEAPPTVLPQDKDTSATSAPFGPTLQTSLPFGPGLPAQVGRFQVRARLGAGAFGAVYRAYDPHLEREVALKVPHPGSLDRPTAAERFLREAKAAARLRHPHIVPVFDAGFDGMYHYIAAAFIEGCTLAQAIEEHRLDYRQAAEVVCDLAGALDYAHQAGVVHRDVKPANVMLDQRGDAYLTDFGLAHRQDAGARLTQPGGVLGTPAYMAPEQAAGQSGPPLPASDQYSLGVILYELLCGRVPFSGTLAEVLFKVQHCDPPPPRVVAPGAPPRLEAICLKAMARKVESRYASVGEFAAAVARALAKNPEERWPTCGAFVAALQAPGRKAPAPEVPKRPAGSGGPRGLMSRLLRPLALLLGLLALAAGVLGVFWLSGGHSPGRDKLAQKVEKPAEGPWKDPVAAVPDEGKERPKPKEEPRKRPEPKENPQKEPAAPPPPVVKSKEAPTPKEREPFTNSVGMKFVWIKPGTFRMGSPPGEEQRYPEETPHRVTLTKGFHLGAHLVTQRQWEQVMGKDTNKSRFMGKDDEEKGRLPMDNVSWNDCQEFCRKLGALEGRRYRLPTEAEWEYASRSGTETAFWWGDGITTEQANYDGDFTYGKDGKEGKSWHKTTPVNCFRASPWGLHDMHGNLWQWCEDAYGPYGEGDKIDPLNASKGDEPRVLRGGSWFGPPKLCRAAFRGRDAPGNRRYGLYGWRVVLCLD